MGISDWLGKDAIKCHFYSSDISDLSCGVRVWPRDCPQWAGLSLPMSPLQRGLVLSSGHTELGTNSGVLQNKSLLGCVFLVIPKGLPDALSALTKLLPGSSKFGAFPYQGY